MSRASQSTGRGAISVSEHAALRWTQRIGRGVYAPEAVRRAFRRSVQVRRDDLDGDVFLDDETSALLVVRGREIVTVWREVSER